MRTIVYTRQAGSSSSITLGHWHAMVRRHGLEGFGDPVICHSRDDLLPHLQSADLILSSKADLRLVLRPGHERVRMVFFAFAGVDHLAPFDWVPRGAYVVNNSGVSSQAAGEYVVLALQLLANGIIRSGTSSFDIPSLGRGFSSLARRDVTIVGAGALGQGVADKCKSFRMNVSGVRRSGAPALGFDTMYAASQLETAVGRSDFVVIACPVTAETRGLFTAQVMASMKRGAGLINIARGAIVDEDALCDAVRDGTLGGAVLDVVRGDAAEGGARVRNTPGILVTPHVSGDDEHAFIDKSLDVFARSFKQMSTGGRPTNAVDLDLGY